MLDDLLRMDTDLFLSIHHVRNGFFDFLAPWLSSRWIWIPLYLWFAVVILNHYKSKSWIIILSVVVMIVISDQGANLFKNNVKRSRPCHNTELLATGSVLMPEGCGGPYGFFSGHASNSFALALMMLLLSRRNNRDKWRPWLWMFVWAGTIAWSRIYLGVHYPGDVLCGAIFGMIVAACVYIGLSKFYLDKGNA